MRRTLLFLCATSLCVTAAGRETLGRVSHGTSEIILISPGFIAVSADSKEVNTAFLSNGKTTTREVESCKVARVASFVAMAAGYVRADAFDALDFVRNSYQANETFHSFAARLTNLISKSLARTLKSTVKVGDRAFQDSLTHQDALEIALIGVESGQPAVEVLSFQARTEASGNIEILSRKYSCPGDCYNGHAAFYLGVHGAVDRMVARQPDLITSATLETASMLNRLEYNERPDIVGGPQTLITADTFGIHVINGGACSDEDLADPGQISEISGSVLDKTVVNQLRHEMDARMAAITNVSCHQSMRREWVTGTRVKKDVVDADLQIVAGAELYSAIQNKQRVYRSMKDLPGAWATGDLLTVLRVTRDSIDANRSKLLSRTGLDGNREQGIRFQCDNTERKWILYVASRPNSVGFEGTAWFSEKTGALRRIEWKSQGPVGPRRLNLAQIVWRLDFSFVDVAGQDILAPVSASYELKYAEGARRHDRSDSTFSGFHRFAASARMLE
jgi:hypothetical protein